MYNILLPRDFCLCSEEPEDTREKKSLHRVHPFLPLLLKTNREPTLLTNHQLLVLGEIVLGNLQVQRRRALSNPAGDVIMRAVARAEPAAEVAGLADGDTAQVCAHAQHDEPFGLLDAVFVLLGISE
jgi:hypothetical protein